MTYKTLIWKLKTKMNPKTVLVKKPQILGENGIRLRNQLNFWKFDGSHLLETPFTRDI